MYNFKDITVVCVDGRVGCYSSSIASVIRANQILSGSSAIFFSALPMDLEGTGIRNICIQSLGYIDYSIFITYILGDFIETPFVLIVQDDGFVINSDKWRDEYFSYDYIGAPSHFAKIRHESNSFYLNGYEWTKYINNKEFDFDILYNGGFSFRSRKLLQLAKKEGLSYKIGANNSFDFNRSRLVYDMFSNEDVGITITNKNFYESHGCLIAPLDVAKYFSIENWNFILHGSIDLNDIFGQHKQYRKIKSAFPLNLIYEIDKTYFHQFDEAPYYEYLNSKNLIEDINNDYIKRIGF